MSEQAALEFSEGPTLPWTCPCGASRRMPPIGSWRHEDASWWLLHQEHGPTADDKVVQHA